MTTDLYFGHVARRSPLTTFPNPLMQLTEEQKKMVTEWIQAGAKLSEIQDRLRKEYDVHGTYMDVRLLVDDLKLMPLDPVVEEPKKPEPAAPGAGAEAEAGEFPPGGPDDFADLGSDAPVGGAPANISVTIDSITRPGAYVSGKAVFSDGEKADWYLDQQGRFGMIPATPGYRPPQQDIAEFQLILDRELQKMGL